jgi:NUMOD4 motif-containing protein
MEEWIPLKDYPGYSASNQGRIRNDKFGRYLALVRMPTGNWTVRLMLNGMQVTRSVPKIICSTFVLRPRPHFDTPIHLDGDHSNLNATNLQWRPLWFAQKFNRQFKINQLGGGRIRDKMTGEEYDSPWGPVKRFGLLYSDIYFSTQSNSPVFSAMQFFEWID